MLSREVFSKLLFGLVESLFHLPGTIIRIIPFLVSRVFVSSLFNFKLSEIFFFCLLQILIHKRQIIKEILNGYRVLSHSLVIYLLVSVAGVSLKLRLFLSFLHDLFNSRCIVSINRVINLELETFSCFVVLDVFHDRFFLCVPCWNLDETFFTSYWFEIFQEWCWKVFEFRNLDFKGSTISFSNFFKLLFQLYTFILHLFQLISRFLWQFESRFLKSLYLIGHQLTLFMI